MNQSMYGSNFIGGRPNGFFSNRRSGGMNLGNVIVNRNLSRQQTLGGVSTTQKIISNSESQNSQIQSKNNSILNIIVEGPDMDELLTIHDLIIKYKKGDLIVPRLKKNLKDGKFHKFVKFRSDKKLEWSPQFYLDGDLTQLRGYMNNELLRINLLEQLDNWKETEEEEEESSGFDDKTDSDEESSEEESDKKSDKEEESDE